MRYNCCKKKKIHKPENKQNGTRKIIIFTFSDSYLLDLVVGNVFQQSEKQTFLNT